MIARLYGSTTHQSFWAAVQQFDLAGIFLLGVEARLERYRLLLVGLPFAVPFAAAIFFMLRLWSRFFPDPEATGEKVSGVRIARLFFVAIPVALIGTAAIVGFLSLFGAP